MTQHAHLASKISLVLADVDGTLVTAEKVLTTRAEAAVKAIHTAGIVFAITSGRPPRGMAMLIDPLALRTPVAGFNGGIFVKPDMTIVKERVLAAEVARRALEVILHHSMDVWVYSGKDWFVQDAPAARKIPGRTRRKSIGRSLTTLLPRRDPSGRQQRNRRYYVIEATRNLGR